MSSTVEERLSQLEDRTRRLQDRLERVERKNDEPAITLKQIAQQAVDRLQKKSAAAAKPAEQSHEISAKTSDAVLSELKSTDKVLAGWTVQDVRYGEFWIPA